MCRVCLFQAGPDASRPNVVVGYQDGYLVPMCDDHLRVARACDQMGIAVNPAQAVLDELMTFYRTTALT